MLLAVILPFAGCIAAIVLLWQIGWMGWPYVALLIGFSMLTEWGVTIGFHRLLSHHSFQTHRWLRAFWMSLGALAVQGSPLVWCAVHRKHHHLSDLEGDPHSPRIHGRGWWNELRGFIYGHTGWLFSHHWSYPELERYVPDLLKDRLLVLVDRLYYLWVLASLALPAVIAGLATMSWKGALLGVIWGGLVRIFIVHHITFSVNSVCHLLGPKEYETNDDSRNNVVVGVLAQGEGWHNNHHAFPTSARHGLKWWQLDMSWLIIRSMQAVGLVWNVQLPSEQALKAKRLKKPKR